MPLQPVKVGVVGCGNISGAYLKISRKFPVLQAVAVADLDRARARAKAAEFGLKVLSTRKLIRSDEVEVVLNLTVPKAHARIALAALKAGKHVFNEKPLGVTRAEGKRILALAAEKKLLVGCAPDTVLGGGLQTCRKLIDDGAIGKPVAATAFMMGRGPEKWHPDPEFFYKPGGGPMFDMGPYYLTALTSLMGPVKRVTSCSGTLINPRVIGGGPKQGQEIQVETPDHVSASFEFASGAIGTFVASFAVWGGQLPRIEIYSTEGTLSCPDPNGFGGPVKLLKGGTRDWVEIQLTHGYAPDNQRSIGLADMACAIRAGRAHRCTGAQAYHVLDVMQGFLDAGRKGRHYDVPSTFDRPAALPLGLPDGQLD